MKTYPESRLTDLLIEFDEMGFCPTTVCPNPEQTAIEWKEQVVKEIQKLQAENAELRERLDKAEHRAEVAERALLDCIKDSRPAHCSISVCSKWTRCGDDTCVETRRAIFIEQAERELAEEGKDG